MGKEKIQSRIWLSPPHLGGQENNYIQTALQSNWVAPAGPQIGQFESSIQNFIGGKKKAVALNSGTAAIHLALVLAGVEAGDEVICQSLTFCASVNPVLYLGAHPIFVDSEPETWNLCPVMLKQAIEDRLAHGKRPKSIIAVHLYGMPYQVDEVHAVASEFNIPVIEDAAEALGSTYKQQSCGSLGNFAIFSFNGNKIITTGGGGILICATSVEKKWAQFLATQAKDEAPHFEHSQLGYNYRMSNIAAAIGCGQVQVLDARIEKRREINAWYRGVFKDLGGDVTFQDEPDTYYMSNYWLTAVQLPLPVRNAIVNAFAKANIESRPVWKPMHLQPLYKNAPFYGEKTAEKLFFKGLCLPSGTNMNEEDLNRIQVTLQSALNH